MSHPCLRYSYNTVDDRHFDVVYVKSSGLLFEFGNTISINTLSKDLNADNIIEHYLENTTFDGDVCESFVTQEWIDATHTCVRNNEALDKEQKRLNIVMPDTPFNQAINTLNNMNVFSKDGKLAKYNEALKIDPTNKYVLGHIIEYYYNQQKYDDCVPYIATLYNSARNHQDLLIFSDILRVKKYSILLAREDVKKVIDCGKKLFSEKLVAKLKRKFHDLIQKTTHIIDDIYLET